MRRVGHGDIAGVFGFGLEAAVQNFHAVDFFVIAFFDAFFNRFQIEYDAPVLLVGGSFGYGYAFFGVIAGGERVFALVVGIAVIQVAVHHHLPGDFHGFAVDGGIDRPVVFGGVVEQCAVVGNGNDVFAVGKYIACFRVTLRTQAVDAGCIGDFNDFVGFHHVAADAADAVVGFVVGIDIATIVCGIGERHVRVVQIAVRVAGHA